MVWRYILAFALSLLVLLAFDAFYKKEPPGRGKSRDDTPRAPRPAAEEREWPRERPRERPREPREEPRLDVPDLPVHCVWSPDGHQLRSVTLLIPRPRRSSRAHVEPFIEVSPDGPGAGPLALSLKRGTALTRGTRAGDDWAVVREWQRVDTDGTPGRWVHEARQGDWKFVRTVTVAREPLNSSRHAAHGAWHLEVRFLVENLSEEPATLLYRLAGASGLLTHLDDPPGDDVYLAHGLLEGDGKRKGVVSSSRPASEIGPAGWRPEKDVAWVGAFNHVALAALFPLQDGPVGQAVASTAPGVEGQGGTYGYVETWLVSPPVTVDAGASVEHDYGLFLGPRDRRTLAGYSSLALADANVFHVNLSQRHACTVDTADGGLRALYLRDIDRPPGGGPDDRADYALLGATVRAPSTLALELYDLEWRTRQDKSLGFSRFPWVLRRTQKENGLAEVILEHRFDGLIVRKRLFSPSRDSLPAGAEEGVEPFHLGVVIEIENRQPADRRVHYALFGPTAIDSQALRYPGYDLRCGYGLWTRNPRPDVTVRDASDIGELGDVPLELDETWENVAWLGLANSYFATVFFPRTPDDSGEAEFIDYGFAYSFPDPGTVLRLAAEKGWNVEGRYKDLAEDAFKNAGTGFASVDLKLRSGRPVEHEFGLFAARRLPESFAGYEKLNIEGINDYGMLGLVIGFFISLLGTLKVLAFGSWGLAIVLLTFCVKLCLHPINRRSQRSMMRFQKQMQKIKPEMDEIKERLSGDRTALNREIQALWKKHGVNPAQQMAGCLIIFLQLPIWIGLYKTLEYAIGLRQSGFLYIDDLTRPDALLSDVGLASLPFLGNWLGNHFNLLPILYVILTVVNQRMQPKPTDPQMQTQYKMMSFMMVFFGFIFYRFPAGFMLYIMTSAALGIIESKIIKRQLKREEESGGLVPATDKGTGPYPSKPAAPGGPAAGGTHRAKRKKKGKGRRGSR
ncbi:MAG: membrane protein insertase YidC [Planctomycetota bacterium]|nr:membrane protein insertase YidC [Planctomycetota bacterium]